MALLKWVGYAWAVITGLITLFIAAAVINHFNEPFERVVVDLLVLIYVAVRTGTQMFGLAAVEEAKTERDRFFALMKAAGDDPLQNEDTRERVKDDNEKMSRAMIKVYIHSVFIVLIFLLALTNLLGAL